MQFIFSSMGWSMVIVIVLSYLAFSPLVAFVLAVIFCIINISENIERTKKVKNQTRRY
jgi:phosphate/sulfate permease